MFGEIFSACCRYLFPFKDNILHRIFFVVTSSYSDHVTTAGFSLKKVLPFENSRAKIRGLSVANLWHMLRTICNGSSCFLLAFLVPYLPRKCFLVTSSCSDHVTTVPWSYIHPSVYITMTNFSAIFKPEN